MTVECPYCAEVVEVPVEWQSPTIPPMLPAIPLGSLVRQLGHVCSERALLIETLSQMGQIR